MQACSASWRGTAAALCAGKHPVNTVRTITRICHAAEKVFDHRDHYDYLMQLAMQVGWKASRVDVELQWV